jgi:predicted nucleic acid-binding protein
VIVADASAVLVLLLRTPGADVADARLLGGTPLAAPHLLDVEVAQVLRRYASRGEITEHRGRISLELLAQFPITRYPHEPLLSRIWQLRANLTAYDAAYVALAEGLRATLITCDARLASAPGIRAEVEVI